MPPLSILIIAIVLALCAAIILYAGLIASDDDEGIKIGNELEDYL